MLPLSPVNGRTPDMMKVAELREELKKRGIQIKGLKRDLVDRLEEVLRQEELEREKTLASDVNDAAAAPVDDAESDPVTPVTKKRSKGHDKEDHAGFEPDYAGTMVESAAVGTEETTAVPAQPLTEESLVKPVSDSDTKPQEGDASSVSAGDDIVALTVPAEEEVPVFESAKAVHEQVQVSSPVANEKTIVSAPALEDLVADLERLEDPNAPKVVQEGRQVQHAGEDETPQLQEAGEEQTTTADGQAVLETVTDIVPTIEIGVDELMGGTEEVITTTLETVTTTVEEQVVSGVAEDQNATIVQEEQVVTTSTWVATMTDSATAVATIEETTTVATEEKLTTVVDDSVKPGSEVVKELEDKSDYMVVEVPKEEAIKVADEEVVLETPNDELLVHVDAGIEEGSIAEASKVETSMDVDAYTEKGSVAEILKDETPMDVDGDSQRGSKRKESGDGELVTLEPTKRRRWNASKGEGDSRGSGTDVQPLEVIPAVNAPVATAKVLTPKSAPPEKVAVTRTARADATVNGEGQKTRVVPPSAKPATTSLKIDKFLRPFTFKAVKELLAQTGTVQDVWMDQIKTHCYVTYSCAEEATATRNALYNLQWPPQGGRLLTAEFVDPSEVNLRSDGEKAASASTATIAPSTNAITPRGASLSNLSKDRGIAPSSSQPSIPGAALLPPPPPIPFPPKDRPNQEVEKTPTLDDLFRKTRSKPQIYYLPLTAQEVANKVAARNREAATKPGVKA